MKWTNVPLGDVCTVTMGQAPPGESYNDEGRGLPLLAGAGDFKDGKAVAKKYTTAATKEAVKGDVVLGIRATVGEKVLADRAYCLGRGVAGLRPVDGRLDPRFLWHWLTHTKAELAAKGRGATFLQVNRADITEMALPLPPIEEQRRIAAILDAGAILRAACEQQLGILDRLPRRLFEQHARAVVGVKPLGDLVSSGQIGLVRAAADLREDGEHEYVRMDSITATGYFRSSILKRTNASISELAKYSVRDGDLILNTRNTRELVGKSAIYRGPVRLFNNNLLRLRFRDGVAPEFVHAYLNSAEGARALAARKSGTTSVFAIYARDLMTIEVPLASRTDQAQFAAVIHESELLRRRLMRRLTSAESLTSSLRARAFTRRL